MTAPVPFGQIRQRRRFTLTPELDAPSAAHAFGAGAGAGDPVDYYAADKAQRAAQRDRWLRIDPTRVEQANVFADETDQIDQMVMGQPKATPRGFWAKLAAVAPDAIASSFASNLDPNGGGVERFLGGLGRGFMQTRANQQAQEEQARQSELEAYKLKTDALARQEKRRQFDITERPEWQRQGYPDFASWQADQRKGTGAALAPRVIGTDAEGNVTVMLGSEVLRFDRAGKPIDSRPSIVPGISVDNAPVGNFRGPGGIGSEQRAITVPEGAARTASPAQQDDLASYDASLADLASAREQVRANTDAFGLGGQIAANLPLVGGIVRRGITRMDAEKNPTFVKARAAVGVLNSTIRKLQSGAAVTPYEGQVLESFTGDEWRDDAPSILAKFQQVEEWIANKKKASESQRVIGPKARPASAKALNWDQYDKLVENGYNDQELEAAGYSLPE